MAPNKLIEKLKQMYDEVEIIWEAESVTEDMVKAYRNNCDNPVSSIGLLADIQQFEFIRFMQFAKWTRNMHPILTDRFMMSKGYEWDGTYCGWPKASKNTSKINCSTAITHNRQ